MTKGRLYIPLVQLPRYTTLLSHAFTFVACCDSEYNCLTRRVFLEVLGSLTPSLAVSISLQRVISCASPRSETK